MDRTTEYIKMSEKAYKSLGKPKPLGFTSLWHEKIKSNLISPFLLSDEGDNKYFPVYRQDQLQEMIKKRNLQDIINDFSDWFNTPSEGVYFNSMEQLWLAFVMAEKFGKVWNGANWIKI